MSAFNHGVEMPASDPEYVKLLVVDDDRDILALLEDCFSGEGYEVCLASTLREARESLARHEVHVILSDQNLPDGNGVDFLAELPGTGVDAIPILMTGYADLNTALEAINRGNVYKFVTKPLDLTLLRQTVRRAIESRAKREERKNLASDVLRYNELLRQQSELQSHSLRTAESKIRQHSRTVRKQRAQIETLYTEIQEAYLRTVTSLCAAIEAKDLYTRGHSDRVFFYCVLIGRRLGLKEQSFEELKLASILHDVGKIGIPDSILQKASSITESEIALVRTHPQMAENILMPLPFLRNVRRIIRQHHEHYDGTGYPDGLQGDEIELESRILAVADAYDAMRSDRPYRGPLSIEAALDQLEMGSGEQFCPLCVTALRVGIVEEGECPAIVSTPIAQAFLTQMGQLEATTWTQERR
jgi:putative two-component system response regulator